MLTEARGQSPRLYAALLVSMVLSFPLSGCGVGYLVQAAHGQWQVLKRRQPLATVIADPKTLEPVRTQLAVVLDARDFASQILGLPDNASYRSFAALNRPYVVWNVVAAPEFSVQPLRWCFPVVGCVAYRGYFKEPAARKFAARLVRRGDDVLVAGVPAYSTLGHFADPVLDTMLRYGDVELAGTIFHELAHQLLYVKGDSDFNEAFAMTVEQEGVARWLAARGRGAELDAYISRRKAQEQVVRLFVAGRSELEALYAQPLPLAERRQRKREILAQTGTAVREYEARQGLSSGYDDWIDQGLNNAHLASIATYFECVPAFQRLLAENGGELPRFYAAVRALGREPAARRRMLCAPGKPGP
ncbi:MAG TPA: aminopeptidase [Steroidobacteraceae bacterium]